MHDEALTVGQVYRKAKNAIAREFRGPIWVSGEIKNIREQRGNWYLALVEPGEFSDGSDIALDIACWAKRKALVQAQLTRVGITLAAGMEVRVQGTVTISKLGKVQLELISLDTDALLGRQAAERRRVYQALVSEGLIERNGSLPMPLVPLRVGLVTSDGSEGCNDFLGQLSRSIFRFTVSLRHSPVQGPTAPALLAQAIDSFRGANLDVIAIVRGGGGELDAFDKEPVARAIAVAGVPVLTGIGHTGDRSLADEVAHSCFITPTACGQAIVARVSSYAERVESAAARIHRIAGHRLERHKVHLTNTRRNLTRAMTACLSGQQTRLRHTAERAHRCADRDLALALNILDGSKRDIARGVTLVLTDAETDVIRRSRDVRSATTRRQDQLIQSQLLWRSRVSAFDPRLQLARGYALVKMSDGTLVKSAAALTSGDKINTSFADGTAVSTVDTITLRETS